MLIGAQKISCGCQCPDRQNARPSGEATGRWDVHRSGNSARLRTGVASRPASPPRAPAARRRSGRATRSCCPSPRRRARSSSRSRTHRIPVAGSRQASPSRVWAFSRTRNASNSAWNVDRSTTLGAPSSSLKICFIVLSVSPSALLKNAPITLLVPAADACYSPNFRPILLREPTWTGRPRVKGSERKV